MPHVCPRARYGPRPCTRRTCGLDRPSYAKVIEAFYPVRLELYSKRKRLLQHEYSVALRRLRNQTLFVEVCMDGRLVIAGRAQSDVVADMGSLGLEPLRVVNTGDTSLSSGEEFGAAGWAQGGSPGADEEEEEDPSYGDYKYLLTTPVWDLTQEKLARLHSRTERTSATLDQVNRSQPSDMWKEELLDLRAHIIAMDPIAFGQDVVGQDVVEQDVVEQDAH